MTWLKRCGFALALGALPGALFLLWAGSVNPFFMDSPVSFFFWLYFLPMVPALVLGLWLEKSQRLNWVPWRVIGGVVLFYLSLLIFFSVRSRPTIEGTKLFVFGLDGATFEQMDPMMEEGELSNFNRLRNDGTSAVLISMEPMFSPLLWTTMASGKAPHAHGIQGFSNHATDVKVPRFWDLAESRGDSIGIYKWLVTYPPRSVRGFIVPAWLAPAPMTWPASLAVVKEIELANRLEKESVGAKRSGLSLLLDGVRQGFRWSTVRNTIAWKLHEWWSRPGEQDRRVVLEGLRVQMDRDVFVAAAARHDPDLLTLTVYSVDALGHRFWRYHEPEAFGDVPRADVKRWGSVIQDAYRQADSVFGEIVEMLPPETQIVMLSDHGFKALEESEENTSAFTPRTERLQARLVEKLGPVDVFRVGKKLTVALQEDAQSIGDLRAFLGQISDEKDAPFFILEEIPNAPRSVGLKLRDERVDKGRMKSGRVDGEPIRLYVQHGTTFSGDHDEKGIFVIRSPMAGKGAMVEDMHLLDVAPTLQALMGIEPAKDLPGTVRFGEYEGSGPASRDPLMSTLQWPEGTVSGASNQQQLKALGYIE